MPVSPDGIDEVFEKICDAAEGFQAADVVFALGLLLATMIKQGCATKEKTPEEIIRLTLEQIRLIVEMELES